ncbi:MAG TPA: peptide deformylase [Jatrophihabitans sp.]|jgi:peptide deformylase|uniref:peptide deformylase n=1 Tax=Jatrophihabitans sp. TaxID=1932789 RepID=UPI002DFB5BC5|nr:peptide deformylase [Jatrophihabitans sp.]
MTDLPPKIRVVGDPVLATPTRPVEEFDQNLATLIEDMFAALAVAEGVGLAAPQIGVDLAVFVYDCPTGPDTSARGHVVNPSIETSGDLDVQDEGCLSVPGPYHELGRRTHATVRGVDKDNNPIEVSGEGYFARCLQHETDHLKGVLYIDHLPRNRRRRVLREMEPFEWNQAHDDAR